MNCRDLERMLFEWDSKKGLPQAARKHLAGCSGCSKLVHLLETQGTSDRNLSPVLDALASRLVSDLRPIRPLLSPGFFLAAFWGLCALIGAFGVYLEGTSGLTAMSSLQSVSILFTLAACSTMLAWSLVRQMVPGSLHRFRPEILPAAVIGSLLLVAIAIFQFQNEPPFWPRTWFCIRMGLSFASLAGLPFWLLLRRGAVLSPGATGAAAGLLAGLAGMTVVEIHCPNLDIRHILVSHVGIAALGALLGYVTGVLSQTVSNRGRVR
jgi:hypothetical protein